MTCFNPYPAQVKQKDGSYKFYGYVSCGSCLACKIQKSSEWAMRLTHEYSMRKKGVFLTLTYNDENLPEDKSLQKKHLQDFHKRLRQQLIYHLVNNLRNESQFYGYTDTELRKIASKKLSGQLKYFACGEYGDQNGRPHYHDIILGFSRYDKEFVSAVKKSWPYCDWNKLKFDDVFGTVNYDSCRYVADYSFSKKSRKDLVKEGFLEAVKVVNEFGDKTVYKIIKQPPFQLISQGIGLSFINEFRDELLQREKVTVHGAERNLPRYYRDKLGLPKTSTSLFYDKAKEQKYLDYSKNFQNEFFEYKDKHIYLYNDSTPKWLTDYIITSSFYHWHMFKTRKQAERNQYSSMAIHKNRQKL